MEVFSACQRFRKERVIHPGVRHAAERLRIERQISVHTRPPGEPVHRQSLAVGTRHDIGARRERVAPRVASHQREG
ncbi:MAG: hypothetical protein DMD66_10165 [Gemmatimonadetes bacterium]|nr:MAG: hypothetical protein DMD66_10165 [Gemmatimonadota bacterium]